MQYREVSFTFPEEATDRDKVMMVLQSPHSFARWCHNRVGYAPDTYNRDCGDCVIEQYLRLVAEVRTVITANEIVVCAPRSERIVTPTWVQRVINFVDFSSVRPTYSNVANMMIAAIQKGEIA